MDRSNESRDADTAVTGDAFAAGDASGAGDGWDRTAALFEALSDTCRLSLLRLLADGPRRGRDLAEATGSSPRSAAGHLRLLQRRGLIRREGRRGQARFRLADAVGTPPGTVFAFADAWTSVEVTPSLGPVAGGPKAVPTEELIRRARSARRAAAAAVARSRSVRADAERTVGRALAIAVANPSWAYPRCRARLAPETPGARAGGHG